MHQDETQTGTGSARGASEDRGAPFVDEFDLLVSVEAEGAELVISLELDLTGDLVDAVRDAEAA